MKAIEREKYNEGARRKLFAASDSMIQKHKKEQKHLRKKHQHPLPPHIGPPGLLQVQRHRHRRELCGTVSQGITNTPLPLPMLTMYS